MCVTPYMAGAGRTPAYLAGREQIIANTAQSFETSERTPTVLYVLRQADIHLASSRISDHHGSSDSITR
jgi:hypothetical protein